MVTSVIDIKPVNSGIFVLTDPFAHSGGDEGAREDMNNKKSNVSRILRNIISYRTRLDVIARM